MDNKYFTTDEQKDFLEKASFESFIKKFSKKSGETEGGTFEVVISTSHDDRHGDVVIQRGISTINYFKQPVVLTHHNWHSDAVGIVDQIEIRSKGDIEYTVARGRFATTEKGQNQRKLYDLGLSGISIGFGNTKRDEESPSKIVSCELLEISFVNIMAQQNASRYLLDEKALDEELMDYAVKHLGLEVTKTEVIDQKETPEETVEEVEPVEVDPVEETTKQDKEDFVEDKEVVEVEKDPEDAIETPDDLTETEQSETVEEETDVEKALKNLQESVEAINKKLEIKSADEEEVEEEPTTEEKYLAFKRNLQSVAGDLSKTLHEAKKTQV